MKNQKIHIIGGGIIGLCSAWYLKKEGFEVTIIDKGNLTDGTSFGNAGMIVPSHFVPMATPSILKKGMKWLLNSKSPFYIQPSLNSDLFKWLWHFYRAATIKKMNAAMPFLYEYNEKSKDLYKELAKEEGFSFDYEEKGLLMLYKTQKQAREEAQLAKQANQFGIAASILNLQDLQKLEPNMALDVLGGIYFPGDAHLYPNLLLKQFISALKKKGVQFIKNTTIQNFKTQSSKITDLIDSNGSIIPIENVLIACGSWSSHLLKKAGVKIHLQAGKGYSFTLNNPEIRPNIPTILAEAKVAITPMGNDLRIGGTLELGNFSNKINRNRVKGIMESLPAYYKNLKIPTIDNSEIWTGYRPCTPDGLPYVGMSENYSNLSVSTGHGMMGLSLGAASGRIISELLTNQPTMIDVHPFRLNRF